MYSYLQSKATASRTIVTLGNMIRTTVMIMIIVATCTLPQITLWQRDVDIDEPAPSLTEEQPVSPENNSLEQQPISERMQATNAPQIQHVSKASANGGIAAGMLSNKIDPSTIASYAKGGGRWSILCSTIARINLKNMTDLPYTNGGFAEGMIARGDAYALALRGAAKWQMIVTSKTSFESDIWAQYDQTHHTIFDVYFYKGSNGGVMQGHRAVVFIGTDDQIYILDPIRWQITAKPQLLSDHFDADGYRGYTMYIATTSYAPADQYKTIEEYHHIQEQTSLLSLVNKGIVTVKDTPLSSDTVLTVNEPIKMTTDGEEITITRGAVITVEHTPTLVWWKLMEEQGKLKAQFTQPEIGLIVEAWDK
jgi:hypothetical protein